MTERVLVLPRSAVPHGCEFHGIRKADARALGDLRAAVAAHGRYLDRPAAEQDPTHKQLIPYVVVRDGERVFLMQRTARAFTEPEIRARQPSRASTCRTWAGWTRLTTAQSTRPRWSS